MATSVVRPLVRWLEGGELREERTADPTGFVVALAARLGPVVPDLEVRRPSLEDVYLAMISEAGAQPPAGGLDADGERAAITDLEAS